MSRTAIIAIIPKRYSQGKTIEASLANVGRTRFPGTGVRIFPFKEADGTFRTALDSTSVVYERISDPTVRKVKMEEADRKRKELEAKTRLKLDGKSPYYNFGFDTRDSSGQISPTEGPYKLIDGDNLFNLDDPKDAITFAWLSVHPKIASSLEAYEDGQYPSDTQFYVKDEETEAAIVYAKKKIYNDAIVKFNSLSPDKKKKIARLCGLPAYENTREEIVYNMMDDFLNTKELPITSAYKGQQGINVFNMYAGLDDHSLYIKDLVEQGFKNQIFRNRGGKMFEGEQKIFENKEQMLEHYLDEKKGQDDLLALEKKLKIKKIASV